eukprot:CAMPEP_0174732754 /NCGR_PEP_ID=MMETSP1094-20130205/59979_1 /TAXON_ID=156173 /ORGANISM="Chrysochromulina brevifilum, Strain UTEX LB 985" /LENGTH=44 /DNA_ID= /DNA_START= /DNA_END= /DNA_ORIENTATION=
MGGAASMAARWMTNVCLACTPHAQALDAGEHAEITALSECRAPA